MKPQLSKAAKQLREQFDDTFPDRDRTSDGWIGDTRHAARKSDHNPDEQGWVRAIDVDKDLHKGSKPDLMPDLVDQLRLACKSKTEKRISYIIFDGQICSSILNWKWRKYTGANKDQKHVHISFKKEADDDGAFFQIPMLGASIE
jgi:hypothetical protein